MSTERDERREAVARIIMGMGATLDYEMGQDGWATRAADRILSRLGVAAPLGERGSGSAQAGGVVCGEQALASGPALRGSYWIDQPDEHSCYTACLASVTGLPWADFPTAPMVRSAATELAYLASVRNHLLAHGWMLVTTGLRVPAGLAIATGPSPRDPALSHCVVVLAGRIIHDPHPGRAGIDLSRANEYEIVVPLVTPDRSGYTYVGPERRRADTPTPACPEPTGSSEREDEPDMTPEEIADLEAFGAKMHEAIKAGLPEGWPVMMRAHTEWAWLMGQRADWDKIDAAFWKFVEAEQAVLANLPRPAPPAAREDNRGGYRAEVSLSADTGSGTYMPEQRSGAERRTRIGTGTIHDRSLDDDWTKKRSGIQRRRTPEPRTTQTDGDEA